MMTLEKGKTCAVWVGKGLKHLPLLGYTFVYSWQHLFNIAFQLLSPEMDHTALGFVD
jgi:hypothetical protein